MVGPTGYAQLQGAKVPEQATQAPPGEHKDSLHKLTRCTSLKKTLPPRHANPECTGHRVVIRDTPRVVVHLSMDQLNRLRANSVKKPANLGLLRSHREAVNAGPADHPPITDRV